MFRPGWTVWCENEPIKSTELARLCKQKLDWSKTTTYTVIKRLSDRGVVKNEERTFHRRTQSFKNQFAFLVWESPSTFSLLFVLPRRGAHLERPPGRAWTQVVASSAG